MYGQPVSKTHTYGAGVDLDLGMDRGMWLQSAASVLSVLPLLEKTPCSNGFHRLQFKGQVHCFLPSFTFYLSLLPPASTLSSPSFLHISNCPQNLILAVLPCCRIFRIETHTATHSHNNIAHPRGRGTGP